MLAGTKFFYRRMLAFVGNRLLLGMDTVSSDIVDEARDALAAGGGDLKVPAPAAAGADSAIAEHLRSMSILVIVAAALADGVNPCAFATIVLLVSMMATARRSRREVLVIGAVFSIAVFITYFAVGLVLYSVLSRLTAFLVVSDLVYYVAFGTCGVCAALSLYDVGLAARGRDPGAMLLKLPDSLRARIQKQLQRGVRSRSLVVGAFVAGATVSLIECSTCGEKTMPHRACPNCGYYKERSVINVD